CCTTAFQRPVGNRRPWYLAGGLAVRPAVLTPVLVSCVVASGFDFAGFRLGLPEPRAACVGHRGTCPATMSTAARSGKHRSIRPDPGSRVTKALWRRLEPSPGLWPPRPGRAARARGAILPVDSVTGGGIAQMRSQYGAFYLRVSPFGGRGTRRWPASSRSVGA